MYILCSAVFTQMDMHGCMLRIQTRENKMYTCMDICTVSGHKYFRTVYFPIDFYVNLVFSLISPKFEFSTDFEFFSLTFPENEKVYFALNLIVVQHTTIVYRFIEVETNIYFRKHTFI